MWYKKNNKLQKTFLNNVVKKKRKMKGRKKKRKRLKDTYRETERDKDSEEDGKRKRGIVRLKDIGIERDKHTERGR